MRNRLVMVSLAAILAMLAAAALCLVPSSTAARGSGTELRDVGGVRADFGVPLSARVASEVSAPGASSGWTTLSSGTTRLLEGVSFTDRSNGFAVGADATILRTRNGGDTWTSLSSPFPGDEELTDVRFATPQDGWVIGWDNMSLHTTDGGASWDVQELLLLYPMKFWCLDSVDTRHTWVGTSNTLGLSILYANNWEGLVIGTDDGGPNWWASTQLLARDLYAGTAILGLDFVDLMHGWAISSTWGIFKSTDGGRSWVDVSPDGLGDGTDISFCDVNNGWAVGEGGVFHTTNGGQSWTQQATGLGLDPFDDKLEAVWTVNPTTCWVVGRNGIVLHSTDGGNSWSVEHPVARTLNEVCFVDAEHGWAVGDGGVILRYQGVTTATPQIASLFPASGVVGTQVTITGTGFGSSGTVLFGATLATTSSWGATAIVATVPSLALGAAQVTVVAGGQTSNAATFVVTNVPPADFTPPTMSFSCEHDLSKWHNHDLPVTFAVSDAGSGPDVVLYSGDQVDWYELDLALYDTLNFPAEADHSWDGDTEIFCKARDKALNESAVQSFHVRIDTRKPTAKALYAVSVVKGRTATLKYRVNDLAPNGGTATAVKIVVKNRYGKVVKTFRLGTKQVNKTYSVRFTGKLAKGSYRWYVSGKDTAGNTAKVGSNRLTVR